MPHMHLLGRSLWSDHYRDDQLIGRLGDVANYDFNSQRFYIENNQLMAGDEIYTHCVWDSRSATQSYTLGGESTDEEMCYNIVLYYPRVDAGSCGMYQDTQGCNCSYAEDCYSRPECNVVLDGCAQYRNCGQCNAAPGCDWCDSPFYRGCMRSFEAAYCGAMGGTTNNCAGGTGTTCTAAHPDCASCNADTANRCGWCHSRYTNESTCLGYPVGQLASAALICETLFGREWTPTCS